MAAILAATQLGAQLVEPAYFKALWGCRSTGSPILEKFSQEYQIFEGIGLIEDTQGAQGKREK